MNIEIIKQRIESNKEYLAGLETCRGIVSDDFLEKERLETETVILALEKQIPKKPRVDDDSWYCCRNCGETFSLTNTLHKRNKHCGNCGQALDWSDTE